MKNTKKSINNNFLDFISKKINYYNNLINKTIQTLNIYKTLDILSSSELNNAFEEIENANSTVLNIFNSVKPLKYKQEQIQDDEKETLLNELQKCNDLFYSIFKEYGTQNISDILNVCFGSNYVIENIKNKSIEDKFDLLNLYSSPLHFKIYHWKKGNSPVINDGNSPVNNMIEDSAISDMASTMECFDMARTHKNFHKKVYGTKVCFQNYSQRKTVIICTLCENMLLECITNDFFKNKMFQLRKNVPDDSYFKDKIIFENFVNTLTIKEVCVYDNKDIYNRFIGFINQCRLIKQKPISQVVKEFINSDLYSQRNTIIQLLINCENPEYNYIAYLLYDLLSSDDKGFIDTREQNTIFDSLPWNIKRSFKNAMKTTIEYTKSLTSSGENKIPLEQQICLMKVNDNVKQKAMNKLKEIKSKSEDTGSKARQYLDGLLRIPFGIYKKEPILTLTNECSVDFKKFIQSNNLFSDVNIEKKDSYTTFELQKYISNIEEKVIPFKLQNLNSDLVNFLKEKKRDQLIQLTITTNKFIKNYNIKYKKLIHSAKKNAYLIDMLYKFFSFLFEICKQENNYERIQLFFDTLQCYAFSGIYKMRNDFYYVYDKWNGVKKNINNVRNILDDAIYGHDNAKRQIERVIGQWMSGDQKGYCFGFEGPPGIGKTSIAKKGLSKCLVDKDGNTRPFGFIAIGGSSNSSTLDGHSYTYVGSTWGRIVDILIESKCMNPIIFIDELDKISNTEHGKEIIGILTHLVDPTQNDSFHDKYFSGIDIDLSKVLFVFSYNDVSLLDRILLDRIHRVQFKNLTLKEKIVITHKHLLPEIFEKITLENNVEITDDVIKYIIETYTIEPGVRKLKEILFEILSEVNLQILHNNTEEFVYDQNNKILLTKDIIKNKYLKERREIKEKKIHEKNGIGIVNGLWANSLGQGGIIPIQCNFYPTPTFLDLKLTGMQGDVMKESMNVAKTLAYTLTPVKNQKKILNNFKDTNVQGLHIHCPEGSVPKDGPSAGTAITVTIYSILNNKKIRNDVAITGEINLKGNITAIGGLDLKILGGIKAGVKEFIFPIENHEDYVEFTNKYENKNILDNIKFHEVSHIENVLKLVFV